MTLDGRPIFLLARSYAGGDDFNALVTNVNAAAGTAVQTGTIVNLPRHGVDAARRLVDGLPGVGIRIVDPELHEHPDFGVTVSDQRRQRAPYLDRPIPARPERAFVTQVIQAQRDAGATVLLTATGRVDEADGERSLARAMRWVHASRAEAPTQELAVNLTLSRTWLTSPQLREALLNELVDSNERLWYLRVRWEALRPRHAQLTDSALLDGYRTLLETARLEGKVVLLPQTGLGGWFLTGLGAGGFSTGTGGPEQAYADPVEIRIRGKRRPPVPRYFEPEVLATLGLPGRRRIAAQQAYRACPCPYCARMARANGDFDATRWDRDQALRHQVVSLARLAAATAAGDRRAATRTVVAQAADAADRATPTLTGEDRPTHLAPWLARLDP